MKNKIFHWMFTFVILFAVHVKSSDDNPTSRTTFSAGIAFKKLGLSDDIHSLKNTSVWGTFFLSEKKAIRVIGQFNFREPDEYSLFSSLNRHNFIVLLSGEFVYSIKFKKKVKFFSAIGPALSITNRVGKNLDIDEAYIFGNGATGGLGIEYSILQNLAFVGEYTTSFFYIK